MQDDNSVLINPGMPVLGVHGPQIFRKGAAYLDKLYGAKSLELRPYGFGHDWVKDDDGGGDRITAPQLLSECDKAVNGPTHDDVVLGAGILRPGTVRSAHI